MRSIRPAEPADLPALYELDHVAREDAGRRDWLRGLVEHGGCAVCVEDGRLLGYGAIGYHFFGQAFVELLYCGEAYRRRGVAGDLMGHFERCCGRAKLFTSTNMSNFPMQQLLLGRGYVLAGVIHHLDEGDPEVFYVRLGLET